MADPSPDDSADAAGESAPTSATGERRRPGSAKPRRARGAARAEDWLADIDRLSYQEARTALELALARLQSSELEVEEMAGLYRRAQAYAGRCEAVLQQVEQDVIQWDPQTLAPPAP